MLGDRPRVGLLVVLSLLACTAGDRSLRAPPGPALAIFDLDADLDNPAHFFDAPYPSDLRVSEGGRPRLAGFPNPRKLEAVETFRRLASERAGFPVLAVAYFRFTAPLPLGTAPMEVTADPSAPGLLIDVDPSSPERGRLFPGLIARIAPDGYAPPHLVALAARPGVVLAPRRTYAAVLLDNLGGSVAPSPALRRLARGEAAAGKRGQQALRVYAPLWSALRGAGVDPQSVIAATVFTTGDAVADTSALGAAVLAQHRARIGDLALLRPPEAGDSVCALTARVRLPQFQRGAPPFDAGGLFQSGPEGLPLMRREERVPLVIALPRQPMPPGGFPLALYFHGSGGASGDSLDKGPSRSRGGEPQRGRGPAWMLGLRGIATAAAALPASPERLSGASETAYLNLRNPAALRDTVLQGVLEQRLLLSALLDLEVAPSALAGCGGPLLPPGARAFRFDGARVVAQGQSMGGMYANIVGATDPRVRAVVPTGAGGFWTWFLLTTRLRPALPMLVSLLLGTGSDLSHLHPALGLVQAGLEPADPFAYLPRLAQRPLPGHPARPVFEPVADGDEYFPLPLYQAAALAYGNALPGELPLRNNLRALDGRAYTGAVAFYRGDGLEDPHQIYRQLDGLRQQIGCFLGSFVSRGIAVLPPPSPLGASCAE